MLGLQEATTRTNYEVSEFRYCVGKLTNRTARKIENHLRTEDCVQFFLEESEA